MFYNLKDVLLYLFRKLAKFSELTSDLWLFRCNPIIKFCPCPLFFLGIFWKYGSIYTINIRLSDKIFLNFNYSIPVFSCSEKSNFGHVFLIKRSKGVLFLPVFKTLIFPCEINENIAFKKTWFQWNGRASFLSVVIMHQKLFSRVMYPGIIIMTNWQEPRHPHPQFT